MDVEVVDHSGGGGPQCLGDDLAPVQATPRIARAGTDIRVRPV